MSRYQLLRWVKGWGEGANGEGDEDDDSCS